MQHDEEADMNHPDGLLSNRNALTERNENTGFKSGRLRAFVLSAAALIIATAILSSNRGASQESHNYAKHSKSIKLGTPNHNEVVIDDLMPRKHSSNHGIVHESYNYPKHSDPIEHGAFHQNDMFLDNVSIFDLNGDQSIFELSSTPYHPEKSGNFASPFLDEDTSAFQKFVFDEDQAYFPGNENTDKVFNLENELANDATIHENGETHENRVLQEKQYLYPLPCNKDVEFDCAMVPLSSLPVPTDGSPLVIECGTCVYVDTYNGEQLTLPNGLRIEGKLYFPAESSVTIRTIYVMVLGILKMEMPSEGKQVKFSLYGEQDIYFFSDPDQQDSRTSACENGCKIGKKPIAVVGGRLDIQGYDSSCPSWENLLDISAAATNSPTAAPSAAASPTLPPNTAYAGNVMLNGDFSDPSGSTHPWGGYATDFAIHEDAVVSGNTALETAVRSSWGEGLHQFLNLECFTDTTERWKLEMDVRLLDGVTREGLECEPAQHNIECPMARFQAGMPGPSYPWYFFYDQDMEWNKDGWSHFSIVFDSPEDWLTADWLLLVVSGGPENSILVIDNVSLERFNGSSGPSVGSAGETNQIHLSQQAAACWTPGSEIVITSNNVVPGDHQIATIESTDPDSGTLKLTSNINLVSTVASDPDHAVEVALLNRRIIFEADDDEDDDLIGGHLIVLLTPNVTQHLQGVEIRNFGQQGNLGRYPVHFHLCHDAFGSVVKKNVVRQSNQRCYVMHGTNGVTIEDNVAFDTFGHCYMTEDGVEHSNHFIGNLGAHIKDASKLLDASSGRSETDDKASVFWMTNMENYFEGNVAAGSETHGFWVETHFSMDGRGGSSYQRPDHKPIDSNLGSFKDNTAHSFVENGFTAYPPGWNPTERAIIENFRAYRGFGNGIFLHNNKNLSFMGGYIAHVRIHGIMIFGADDIIVDGMELVGNIEGEPEQCGPGGKRVGVSIYPHRSTTRTLEGQHFGAKLRNLNFRRWSPDNGCATTPLDVSTTQIGWPAWDAYNLMDNIIHDGSHPNLVSACEYESKFASDTTIEVSGDAATAYGGSGFLVGPLMVPLSGSTCEDVGGCLYFCPGACLRTIKFRTSVDSHVRSYVMKVSDGIHNITVDRFNVQFGHVSLDSFWETSTYSVSLPAGDFTVWFEDENDPGVMVYPKFVLPFFEAEPSCSNYATPESITILKPPAEDPRCGNLIRNGDFADNIDGWQEWGTQFFHSETAGENGSGALVTGMTAGHTQVTQWLDVSCLVENDGEYLFHASYRIVDQVSDLDNAQDFPNRSRDPGVYMLFETWDEEKQEAVPLSSAWPEAIAPPTQAPTQSPPRQSASPTSTLPQLSYKGNNGHPAENFPLSNCEGDCDHDGECQAGLVCMQRNSHESVPGCAGLGTGGRDYCMDPNYTPLVPLLNYVGNNGSPAEAFPLGECEGDCDNDNDCQGGLLCMQMSGVPVPGCGGIYDATTEYCYDPSNAEPTPAPTTASAPTSSPSGFEVLSGAFTITPEQAASTAARIIIFSFENNAILDNISLVKAPWSKAVSVMSHIVETMQPAFEASVANAIPTTDQALGQLFDDYLARVEEYAQASFPGGLANLDAYDDGIEGGLPSYKEYVSSVLPALEQTYAEANAAAAAEALQAHRENWESTVKNAMATAIEQAVSDLLEDLADNDDGASLPYLDEEAYQALQNELAEVAESEGDRLATCAATE